MTDLYPHDHEAERQLIGSLLIVPDYIADAAGIVKPSDFHLRRHREIFAALVKLGANADVLTVADTMKRAGAQDPPTESELAGMTTEVAYPGSWEHHARAVAGDATRRRYLHACEAVARTAHDQATPPAELASMAALAMSKAGEGASRERPDLQAIVAEYLAQREADIAAGGKPTGIPSGLEDLDRLTNGWKPGQLVTVAGPTSTGKTTLMLQFALHAARRGRRVLILTLEMAEAEIMTKLVANFGRVNNGHATTPDFDAETRAANGITQLPLAIRYVPGATVGDVLAEAHRERAIHGALDLIVVDYIQIMSATQDKGQTRAAAIGAITRELKAQAGKLGAAILVGSQLNREGSAAASGPAPVPQLFHLRESGDIEQDSSVVLMLHDPQDKESPELRALYVRKQRNGKTGKVDLIAKFEYSTFYGADIETVPLEALK